MLKRAVFLDRDGVINETIFRDGKPRAPDRVEDFVFLPGVEESVARLRAAEFLIVVVTNQPDVARGWQKRENVEAMNRLVAERLRTDAIEVCYHVDADGCVCRKPLPGLLLKAAAERGIDLGRSFMVGDRRSDIEAGRAAGCRGNVLIAETISEDFAPDARFSSLAEAAGWIISHET